MNKSFSTPTEAASQQLSFVQLWCIEAVRLKETQWGPLADEVEVRRARTQEIDSAGRIAVRAQLLCARLGWASQQQTILRRLRWLLWAWLLVAILVGAGAAQAALGFGSVQVNLIRAWMVLLAVPTIGLGFWVVGALFRLLRPMGANTVHARWRWLTNKIARGPDSPLLLQALFNVLQQQRLTFWLLSWLHHLFWAVALAAAALRLWFLLAFKRYYFQWESTLFDAERFVQLAQWASVGLRWLGVGVPDETAVRLSDGLTVLPPSGHALWASWLLGSVLLYGFLPRLLLGGLSLWRLRQRASGLHCDLQRSGLIELQPRLAPEIEVVGIDAPSPPDGVPLYSKAAQRQVGLAQDTAVVGMELADATTLVNKSLPAHWRDLGVVDTRAQRQALLDQLQAQPPEHLVMVCDGRQTPDRGLMAWLVEVAQYVANASIVIYAPQSSAEQQDMIKQSWQHRLQAAGLVHYCFYFGALAQALSAFAAQLDATTTNDVSPANSPSNSDAQSLKRYYDDEPQ